MAPMGDEQPVDSAPRRLRWHPGAVAGAVLGALAALFALLNSQSVEMDWIFASTKTPLIVVIALFSVVGFAAGLLVAAARRRHDR